MKRRGRDFRAERLRAGISQQVMAAELGMHRSRLSAIEMEQVDAATGFEPTWEDALEHLSRERGGVGA